MAVYIDAAMISYRGMRMSHMIADPLRHLGWTRDELRRDLAGKNLACWCPLDRWCHRDILLRYANQ